MAQSKSEILTDRLLKEILKEYKTEERMEERISKLQFRLHELKAKRVFLEQEYEYQTELLRESTIETMSKINDLLERINKL